MVVICEPECYGKEHAPLNSAFLQIVTRAFPEENVLFFGEATHIDEIKRVTEGSVAGAIDWRAVPLPPRYCRPYDRFLADLKLVKMLLHNERREGMRLVLTSNNASTLVALKSSLLFTKATKAQVFLHSELSSITARLPMNPINILFSTRTSLMMPDMNNVQFIVLEKKIKEELVFRMASMKDKVAVLDHPLPTDANPESDKELTPPIKIGFIGSATEKKGFALFCEMAVRAQRKWPGVLEFHVVGKVPKHMLECVPENLREKVSCGKMERPEFAAKMRELHFACLPYDIAHYGLVASGALLDAIAWEVPLILSNIPIFNDLFSTYGQLGFQFDTPDGLVKIPDEILSKCGQDSYDGFVRNLRFLKSHRRVDILAGKYRAICSRFFS
jgi:hypothetical protein